MPKSFKEMLEGTTEQAAQLEIIDRNQKLQQDQQLEYKRQDEERNDKRHRQQCRIAAFENAVTRCQGYTTEELLSQSELFYEWLVKTP